MVWVDIDWGGEHTVQQTDDVWLNRAPETWVILLTIVIPINVTLKSKYNANEVRGEKGCGKRDIK